MVRMIVLILLIECILCHSSSDCVLRGFVSPLTSLDVGHNPYGMITIPRTVGSFHKDDLLISSWNDANNNNLFGQGNIIKQIRNHQVINTIAIGTNQLGKCAIDNVGGTGLGFTMAMAYIGDDKIIQCSVPIDFDLTVSDTNTDGTVFPPHPGCCLVIDSTGEVLATFRGNGINGPWGATSYINEYEHSQPEVTLFISNVLGPIGSSLSTNNGKITRYKFRLPIHNSDWTSGSDDQNVGTLGKAQILASGFTSSPVDISAGTVGPSGLAFLANDDVLIIGDTLGNENGQLLKINSALECQSCTTKIFAVCGENQCLNPIGLNWSKFNLLVANGGDGNLVQYDKNGQEICFTIGDADGGGILFNVLANHINDDNYEVVFVDDAQNTALFLSPFNQ